mgnify:FL=1
MIQPDVNFVAVVVAAIANMIIGSVWYAPPVFGKIWMELSGITGKKINEAKKRGMGKAYFAAFISSLVMSYVLACFIDYTGSTTASGGAQTGFWLWLGFIAPIQLGMVLWEGKPIKLYILNILHYLVTLMVMGVILAIWV